MNRSRNRLLSGWLTMLLISALSALTGYAQSYKIVDTGQKTCYNANFPISAPSSGQVFYGQDAQYDGNQPHYQDNGDGTVSDLITGLMWHKSADLDGDGDIDAADKITLDDALAGAASFNLGGYNDWRLPSIKELYSLILFSGLDPSGWEGTDTDLLTPFIDTDYFIFGFGDVNSGERIIDAQYASATRYVGTTMLGDETVFGVNFADGRIKGYGLSLHGSDKSFYIKYVRGNASYGINEFSDNGDGTINDNATGLMWQQFDSEMGLNWQEALSWVQQKNSDNDLGYNDWRLPNVKELQSIIDYTRSPTTSGTPAIDPLFYCSVITDEGGNENYPFYWSSTTHANMVNGANAAYVAFGQALGWMSFNQSGYQLLDVHGTGAQRSDPKTGDPTDYPYGHGPQGDVIRIYNYERLVRDIGGSTGMETGHSGNPGMSRHYRLNQNFPNPFNTSTKITFFMPEPSHAVIKIYNLVGELITILVDEYLPVGNHSFLWAGENRPSGIYYYTLSAKSFVATRQMICLQ